MGKYCCFICPSHDYKEKRLEDKCPSCGRQFGFPLFNAPAEIHGFKIIRPLDRGFYGATYVAESAGPLKAKAVLKVSPKAFYSYFSDKDFERECQTHLAVAAGTDHIVKIRNMYDDVVRFGDDEVDCYIAELDYIDGPLLSDYLDGNEQAGAQTIAQISVDLLRLKEEFEKKNVYHNDLHAGNIIVQTLDQGQYRANAIDGSIRAVAIDLGSVLDKSKSDSLKGRYGDLHWIGDHIDRLIAGLLRDPDQSGDVGYRLASALQLVFHQIAAEVEKHRTPAADDLIEQISEAYWRLPRHPWRPWTQPLRLRSFGSSYNAQTLQPWHVPLLLVDNEDEWLNRITIPGPQVITGMRGCGKTIFLRALQFHARASKKEPDESERSIIKRIREDDFLGLFVSAQRLLEMPTGNHHNDVDPFPRLFVAYALEAVRAVMHLADIDRDQVVDVSHVTLSTVISEFMSECTDIGNATSLQELDQALDGLLVRVSRGDTQYRLLGHPSDAFIHLAEAVRRCAGWWSNVQILYLLDDVSTRYLKEPRIRQLLSALLFQNPNCAFKMTSEVQTMQLGLTTPGESLLARVGRDLADFDLGSEVYKRIKSSRGKQFVEQILSRRAQHFPAHPKIAPSAILGDRNLETIALEIASSKETSGTRKEIYRGITALAHVCVGDIGDVISLYERILRQVNGRYPVPARVQSECFQDHCSHRLYDLNRRGAELKDVAKSFAEASYELLVKSYRDGKKNGIDRPRLRQYGSIYVRVTAGDTRRQIEQLRNLIDAGVFVFAGGSPRSKTRDSDPILQFKLTYRRIYGLVNYIGLAERDRFELSGSELEEWLNDPSNGKERLLRNLGGGLGTEEYEEPESAQEAEGDLDDGEGSTALPDAPTFFDVLDAASSELETDEDQNSSIERVDPQRIIPIETLSFSRLRQFEIGAVVLGLGFEKRTLESVRKLVRLGHPKKVYAVEYSQPGKTKEILEALSTWNTEVRTISYEVINDGKFIDVPGPVLVDVTGLAKPVIFHVVRASLKNDRSVFIGHTSAKIYYPTNTDLKRLVQAQKKHDRNTFFEILAQIMTGEERPYELVPLVISDADQTRRRVLFAFASPKHERLLSLLDEREFDRLEIVAPKGDTARNRVAREIADIAATDNSNSRITLIDSDDLPGAVDFLLRGFAHSYVELGLNFEIGLTGSKMEAVAAAAVSSIRKVTQCWYVRPQSFDPDRFTKGAGKSRFFRVSVEG